jgi:hypothetical protein
MEDVIEHFFFSEEDLEGFNYEGAEQNSYYPVGENPT